MSSISCHKECPQCVKHRSNDRSLDHPEAFGQKIDKKQIGNAAIVKIAELYLAHLVSDLEQRKKIKVEALLLKALTDRLRNEPFKKGDHIHLRMTKSEDLGLSLGFRRLVYLDQKGVMASELVGKYAVTLPITKDISHASVPVKILCVTPEGQVVIVGPYSEETNRLSTSWNHSHWVLPTPTTCAKSFFMNLCLDLKEDWKKEKALKIVEDIFGLSALAHLPIEHPFKAFRSVSKKFDTNKKLLSQIDSLEEILGPVRVQLIDSSESRGESRATLKSSSPHFKEMREVYLDQKGVRASELVGKYAVTLPVIENKSYAAEPAKILYVAPEGQVVVAGPYSKEPDLLDTSWNRSIWVLPTPTTCAKSFFMNLCLDLKEGCKREKALEIVEDIFRTSALAHLPTERPFEDFRKVSEKFGVNKDLLSKIDLLEEILGDVRIQLIDSSERPTSKL